MKKIRYARGSPEITRLTDRGSRQQPNVKNAVEKILSAVAEKGDPALFALTRKFDGFPLSEKNIRVRKTEIKKAAKNTDKKLLSSLKKAAENIRRFHEKQLARAKADWKTQTTPGVYVGEKTTPIENVGCYIPGGRAAYPTTVLMTAIPAKVAGAKRVAVVSPPPIPQTILAACNTAGVTEVYQIGGAQAIAALAYGTKTIKKVDKIVGPGNKYVTEAKRQVYGTVDVDMPAGPSEILVLADDTTDPALAAADLIAQAEHDPDAVCVLAADSAKTAAEIEKQITKQSKTLARKNTIKKSLKNARIVLVKNTAEAVEFANEFAAEHVEVLTKNPRKVAAKIKNAGAVFVGPNTPVASGDYASGGNHVLPTGGAARYSSPLSVRDFLKTTSVQENTREGIKNLADAITKIAEAEGLAAHAKSARKRLG